MAKSSKAKTLHLCESPDDGLSNLSEAQIAWARSNRFEAKPGQLLAVPDASGEIATYLYGLGPKESRNPLQAGGAASSLPAGQYRLRGNEAQADLNQLAFMLGAYSYRVPNGETDPAPSAELAEPASAEAISLRDAAFLSRDLINAPANLLGPNAFAERILQFAKSHKMTASEIRGDDLLDKNFPLIHTVGRASVEPPRLLDLSWGKKSAPKVTLVGKGVTFDTGGLDIKTVSGMALMKKDMGGAANILGLAHAIMANRLNVRLRVLLPVVENAISGSAFRPGDVLPSRKGLTVEIGNTDAEGRLILADALTLASEDKPHTLVDMATLTGAARIALGFDLPALFSPSDELSASMISHGEIWGDPLWRMPLYQPYARGMNSKIADINHISSSPYGGATVAALFLQRFVENTERWAHFDLSGWSFEARPGRPVGGADLAARAVYFALKEQFGST